MPYIFLVAILMIMPEGIGDAYEKWKIDRLRKKRRKQPTGMTKLRLDWLSCPLEFSVSITGGGAGHTKHNLSLQ